MTSIILYDSVSLYSVDCVILTFGFQVSSKCLLTDGGWTDGSLLCEVLSAQCRVPPVCTGGLVESTPGGGKALPPVDGQPGRGISLCQAAVPSSADGARLPLQADVGAPGTPALL